jgi:hypothetical protein
LELALHAIIKVRFGNIVNGVYMLDTYQQNMVPVMLANTMVLWERCVKFVTTVSTKSRILIPSPPNYCMTVINTGNVFMDSINSFINIYVFSFLRY